MPSRFIPRFGVSERAAHWLLAFAFAMMLASGVFMGGGVGPLGHHVLPLLHVGAAVVLRLRASRSSSSRAAAGARLRRRFATSGLTRTDWRWLRLALVPI